MNKICEICKDHIETPRMIAFECRGTDDEGKVITEKFYKYEHHECSGIIIINAEIYDE